MFICGLDFLREKRSFSKRWQSIFFQTTTEHVPLSGSLDQAHRAQLCLGQLRTTDTVSG